MSLDTVSTIDNRLGSHLTRASRRAERGRATAPDLTRSGRVPMPAKTAVPGWPRLFREEKLEGLAIRASGASHLKDADYLSTEAAFHRAQDTELM